MLGSDYTMFLCFEMINLSDTRTNHSFAVFYDLHPTMNYENIQDKNLILTSRFLLYETLDVIKKRAVLVIIGIIHTESRHNGDQPETDCFGFSCHVLTPLDTSADTPPQCRWKKCYLSSSQRSKTTSENHNSNVFFHKPC